MKFLSTALLALIITFSSCKKGNKESLEILTSKIWNRGLIDKNPSSNPPGSVKYYAILDCEKDDTFKFNSNGSLIVNRNTAKCNESELQTESHTYTINRTTKELIINGTKFTLLEESADQIKYYAVLSPFSDSSYLIFLLQ